RKRRHRRPDLATRRTRDRPRCRRVGSCQGGMGVLQGAQSRLQQQGGEGDACRGGTTVRSIYIDDDLEAIRQSVRDFVEKELVPNVEIWEEAGEVPREVLLK